MLLLLLPHPGSQNNSNKKDVENSLVEGAGKIEGSSVACFAEFKDKGGEDDMLRSFMVRSVWP